MSGNRHEPIHDGRRFSRPGAGWGSRLRTTARQIDVARKIGSGELADVPANAPVHFIPSSRRVRVVTLPRGCSQHPNRAAASISTVALHLDTAEDAVALTTDPPPCQPLRTVEQRILERLEAAATAMTATALRRCFQVRNASLQAALVALFSDGKRRKERAGYAVAR